MSHLIDIAGIYERLFILEHLAYGSRAYCRKREIAGDSDTGYGEFDDYWGSAKSVVSNYVIDCAIKLRMIDDYCRKNFEADELNRLHEAATKERRIGTIRTGSFPLSLRECSNKIVHADRTELVYEVDPETNDNKYWTGEYEIWGTQRKTEWNLNLDIPEWSRANASLLESLEMNEMTFYMGQDSSTLRTKCVVCS